MRLSLVVVLVSVGCTPEHGNYPPGAPWTDNTGGNHGVIPDGGVVAEADAARPAQLTGWVCQMTDFRIRPRGTTCAEVLDSGATLTVLETAVSSTVAADGSFTIAAPLTGSVATLRVGATATHAGVVHRVTLTTSPIFLPDPTLAYLDELWAQNGLTRDTSESTVLVHLDSDVQVAIEGAVVDTIEGVSPRYDAGDAVLLSPDPPTGSAGAAVYLDPPLGDYTVTATKSLDTATLSIPVGTGTFTYAHATL
jgi:hypothetical protein